ncbi:MAG: bifunctional methionine sulfoxide reductase B/A protein [Planctomycetaceae bacterium]
MTPSAPRPGLPVWAVLVFALGCSAVDAPPSAAQESDAKAPASEKPMISVKVFNAAGELVGPVTMPKVVKTEAEWRQLLTADQYRITRDAATERAFCGTLLDNKKEGVYACICCSLPLFSSGAKFDSGTGWPSFFQPIAKENVARNEDRSHGMVRVEILCARCDAHLGHVFPDGPRPTGERHCLNSESLRFTPREALALLADPAADGPKLASVVFAGGCFWCVEAVFEELEGVVDAVSGYAGGTAESANYEAVCTGRTAHAEAVRITYDPAKISYEQLLEVHFATHDPTTLDRQGNDTGPQYRSAIFFSDEREEKAARAFLAKLKAAGATDRPIVTTIDPLVEFFPAESYHQNYVCNNPNQGYVRGVALPKVKKVREKFPGKLKEPAPPAR